MCSGCDPPDYSWQRSSIDGVEAVVISVMVMIVILFVLALVFSIKGACA